MTPQERQLIDDLFDRLARLENSPRDADAQVAIVQGLRKAPNAVYALVQTALVQDEALKRAHERIQELEARRGQRSGQSGGFLNSMREASSGRTSGRPGPATRFGAERSRARHGRPPGLEQRRSDATDASPRRTIWRRLRPTRRLRPAAASAFGAGGGSFLGTAAAAAAGVVGGSLLARQHPLHDGRRRQPAELWRYRGPSAAASRTAGGDQSGGDLAKDAGINDIASSARRRRDNYGSRQGMFDQPANEDYADNDIDHDSDGFDGDGGDDDA